MTPFRLRHACALALGLAGLVAATSGPARADVLELSDGRLVEGRVVKSGDELLVLSRFGVSSVAASDVVARHEGVSADAQVKSVLAKLAPDDFGNRVRVATWLKALGREDEARALAEEVLAADPEQEREREPVVPVGDERADPRAAEPAQRGHRGLETAEEQGDERHVAPAEAPLRGEAAARRDRRRVHREPEAEHQHAGEAHHGGASCAARRGRSTTEAAAGEPCQTVMSPQGPCKARPLS